MEFSSRALSKADVLLSKYSSSYCLSTSASLVPAPPQNTDMNVDTELKIPPRLLVTVVAAVDMLVNDIDAFPRRYGRY